MRVLPCLVFAAFTATADPEPIHRDEPAQPQIDMPQVYMNPTHKHYVLAHHETRHVEPRSVEECYQLTHHVVNEDFMKCRHGYDYQAWVAGHYTDN